MRLLVSNDDGIGARGLAVLADAVRPFGEVTVAAPNQERSACSHSLTTHHPLRCRTVDFPVPVARSFSIDGTPADCVKLALNQLFPQAPDFVLSGVNRGANLAVDVFYSGTVAAAFEGVLKGIPALAFSLNSYDEHADFSLAAPWIKRCMEKAIAHPPPAGAMYNINIPALPPDQIKGIKITSLGHVRYQDLYEKRLDPYGRAYYWLNGEPELSVDTLQYDIVAVRQGWVSVTPLRAELTDFGQLEYLGKVFAD